MTASGRFFYGRNMANKKIQGRKGGSSSSRTPTEQPDDLQSVAKQKSCWRWVRVNFPAASPGKVFFWMVRRCLMLTVRQISAV
jgi:hypothetical protein